MTAADLIIIGAGPGGYETAVAAAKAGLQTVIVEAEKVGGTCLNVGCIPTKCLCHTADVARLSREAQEVGVETGGARVDVRAAVERKNRVVAQLTQGVETLLGGERITLVGGKARFVDSHTIAVEGSDEQYTAPNIIVATGSVTKYLPIEGKDLPGVVSSTELLDIDELPERLCIIGGGVIGLEFASIFNSFGSMVTVVEFCKEILPNFDSDIAKRLRLALKSQGVEFVMGAAVNGIRKAEGGLEVGYELKGKQGSTEADVVLMAVGRAANTASLNLDDVGIEYDRRGIRTDDDLRTNIQGVWAIGDINGRIQLAHAASAQGRHVLAKILGRESGIRLDIVPAAVFTAPEAASVGVTADYCKAQGIEVRVSKAFFRANGKALAMNESEGMVKLLSDPATGRLMGCHMFGPHSADLVQEVAALMNKDATLEDLHRIIHGHPTLGETVWQAAEA